MKFHTRTLELFGQFDLNLALDMKREAQAIRTAAKLGVTLPAAAAEWYRVPELSALWRWYLGFPQYDDHRSWADPPVCRDPRAWVRGRILRLVSENYGSWEWGVLLDETADPPAVASFDDGETWDTCTDFFSSKVYSIVFDAVLYELAGIGRDFAIPQTVSPSDALIAADLAKLVARPG